jgi:hypothetical protein
LTQTNALEQRKGLTPSCPEPHDIGALSVPAAINRPLTFFPLGENCEGFTRKESLIKTKD